MEQTSSPSPVAKAMIARGFGLTERLLDKTAPLREAAAALPVRRALVFVKHGDYFNVIDSVCRLRGISLEAVGTAEGKPISAPEALLPNYKGNMGPNFEIRRHFYHEILVSFYAIIYGQTYDDPALVEEGITEIEAYYNE